MGKLFDILCLPRPLELPIIGLSSVHHAFFVSHNIFGATSSVLAARVAFSCSFRELASRELLIGL